MSGFDVLLGRSAVAELEALPSRPRGMLIMALAAVAAREPRDGLLTIWRASWVGACEVIARRRVVLVYAVRPASLLRIELFREDLDRRFAWLGMRRTIHGR